MNLKTVLYLRKNYLYKKSKTFLGMLSTINLIIPTQSKWFLHQTMLYQKIFLFRPIRKNFISLMYFLIVPSLTRYMHSSKPTLAGNRFYL